MRENRFYSEFDTATLSGADRRRGADYRSPFQIDRDRILYTSAFRRLQNKTQVFLSGEYDFYRTRLTHSLEVAQIGRSVCARLLHASDLLADDHHIDPDLVEAACLSHDLGHPPFGHAGERALHALMASRGGFEGNAQTLRLLADTIYGDRGMDPTRAFIDATLKYKTLLSETPDADNHFVYDSQRRHLEFAFGGADFQQRLAPGRERNAFRSVECQVMDWADDTAYSLNDIVDGANAGFIRLENLERWAEVNAAEGARAERVAELCRALRRRRIEPLMGKKVGDFIAAAGVVEDPGGFLASATNRFRYRITIAPEIAAEAELYKEISLDLVFRSPQLQQLDHKAERILGELFRTLTDNYLGGRRRPLRLLPEEAELALRSAREADDPDLGARIVCDTLATMTDRSAVRTYRRLADPEFGSIVDLV